MLGMGECYLDMLVDRLKRESKVALKVGEPQVLYRETFTKEASLQGKFVCVSGGKGVYGDVWIESTPNEEGKGFEFEKLFVGGVVSREYIPAVEQGLKEAMANGVLAGYPLIDVKAKLYDGLYHEVDLLEALFKVALLLALRKLSKKLGAVILEPMCYVEVVLPEEYLGDVMGQMSARRGRVEGMEARGKLQLVNCMVSLAEMFG